MNWKLFGRPKREIQREGDELDKRLADLENQAERLHEEIDTIKSRKAGPYGPINPYSQLMADAPRRVPRDPLYGARSAGRRPPTRKQQRVKRNRAIVMTIFAVLLLAWFAARIWRDIQ